MSSDITQEFNNAKELIGKSNRILLTMHERMDGDDGGAGLAMALYLEQAGKEVTHAIKQGVPPQLKFLPRSGKITDDVDHNNFELLITFGCNELERTGSKNIKNLSVPIINFDHHPDNKFFGQVNVVDSKKSSVAELVYDFFIFHNWGISKDMATCLLTGIVTDTGSFMHSNTTSSTLLVASNLMKKGAVIDQIISKAYKNKTPQILRAWGRAIENSYYDSAQKMIYAVFSDQDLKELGSLPPAAFEGLVETLNTIPEAKFALFLRQEGSVIKGSLRSDPYKNVNVGEIARLLGGGGHKLAAGFSILGKLTKNEIGKWQVT